MTITSDNIVRKTVTIHADVSTVWKALTDPEVMKLWMWDSEIEILSDWNIGSSLSIRNTMNGKSYESKGTILQLEPNKVFQYSYWNSISRVPDEPENYSILDFRLFAEGDETRLLFTQSNFVGEATFEHANFYWNTALEVMKQFIEKTVMPQS